jgi:MYXO-CTERM domain-containing protein
MAERELVMAGQDQAPKAVAQETTIKEIEQAREDLARTIDAITDKVRPANVARRTAGKLRQRVQSVDPKLAGAGAVVVVGVVALLVWRRRR